jgi:putative ABC transport system permease protein
VTTAALSVDRESTDDVVARLRELRGVAGVSLLRKMSEQVRSQSEQTTGFTTLILTIFAVTIAVGVLYNHARVALSMRARELASLRVLGFTQREVATVLFGELGAETLLGLPLGMLLGKLMVGGMVKAVTPDEFRLPAYVQTSTYAFAALVTVLAAILSAWLVRGKIEQLDMIEALKTREG